MAQLALWLQMLTLAALLAACAAPARLPPGAAPPAYVLLPEAIGRAGEPLAIAGYLMADQAGVRLVDGLRAAPGGPLPIGPPAEQVWLEGAQGGLPDSEGQGAAPRYVLAVVRGRLEGPGAYGPGGAYRFRMRGAQVVALTPQETTVAALLARPAAYAERPVRVTGELLVRPGAALLTERLGVGGVPAPGTQQLKLAGPLRAAALPQELRRSPAGDVRFGPVQVEGLWRDGALVPLMILPVID
ncbi:MAG TPA: hypothetical protein VNL77_10235 [Roseiflexaceae bacterium]|nr:hypothetical protein [Roseiflexaceae bacterium]